MGGNAVALAAGPADVGLQGVRQLDLGVLRPQQGDEGGERPLGHVDGAADAAQLVVVLDHAQLFHAVGRGLPLQGRRQLLEILELGHGDDAALEADGTAAELFEDIDGRLGDARGRLADVGFQFGALVGDLADVAGIADEDDAVAAEDDGAAVAGESGEVCHVDGVADEEGVHALVGQQARSRSRCAAVWFMRPPGKYQGRSTAYESRQRMEDAGPAATRLPFLRRKQV